MTNPGIAALALGGLVALRLWTWSNHHHSRVSEIDAPGAEIDVDARGNAVMRECTGNLDACLRAVASREFQRAGGGHYSVDIHAPAASDALERTSHRVIRAGLAPRIELLD